MDKTYTKEFLISELQRFVLENGRNPKSLDMQIKFGYPAAGSYQKRFGTWNNALIEAGLKINQYQNHWQDGTETCVKCNSIKIGTQWYYKNNQRLCYKCYCNIDYMNNNLDPNTSTGFAFISQRVVAKTLGLDLKYDCNCSQGFGAPHDLYDEKLGYINVKSVALHKTNAWHFTLRNKQTPDTYIMLGFSADKSDILHVWITDALDDLTFEKKGVTIRNTYQSLTSAKSWEVDCEPYNDAYHSMSLENCSVLRSD